MKSFLASVLILAGPALGWAQVPPNDEFTNRIPLTGPVAYFGGDISQATFPIDEFEPCAAEWCGPSVWWSWTAKDATPVVIERVGESSQQMSGMAVYLGESPSVMYHGTEVCRIDLQRRGQYVVFQPIPGIEYKILVSGFDTNPVTYRWTVTNAPIFRIQPVSQTVSIGASATLSALAAGVPPLDYQWFKDGVILPSATNRMISFNGMTITNTGNYSAVVASATGVSTSSTARLTVTESALPPRLIAHPTSGTGPFQFSVVGEAGRRYRLELSENLQSWSTVWTGGVLFNTNEITRFEGGRSTSARFVRLSTYRPANEVCINNLRQVWTAIQFCAEEGHFLDSTAMGPGYYGLDSYLIDGIWPRCPEVIKPSWSVEYVMIDCITVPTCMRFYPTHRLEDP